jgi:hypothetical protein
MLSRVDAKALNKAGFERHSVPRRFKPFGKHLTKDEYTNVLMMTELSELVEACSEKDRYFDLHYYCGKPRLKWEATRDIHSKACPTLIPENGWCECLRDKKKTTATGRGSTAEVAVKNLWLTLNKKD